MHGLSLGTAFSKSWDLIKKKYSSVLFFCTLIYLFSYYFSTLDPIFQLVFIIVSSYFYFGLINLTIKISKDETPTYQDFTTSLSKFASYILVALLLVVISSVIGIPFLIIYKMLNTFLNNDMMNWLGLIILTIYLIVFVIILARLFFLAPYYILDYSKGPLDSMRESWKSTKGHVLKIILFMILFALLNALGAILLIVGLLFTLPFGLIAQANVYHQLERE